MRRPSAVAYDAKRTSAKQILQLEQKRSVRLKKSRPLQSALRKAVRARYLRISMPFFTTSPPLEGKR